MTSRIKTWFMRGGIIITCVLYALSLCVLAFPFALQDIFVSPDEHATAVFARAVQEIGLPRIPAYEEAAFANMVHPRSALVVGGAIVPGGFLGMAYVAAVFGMLTPVLLGFSGPLMSMLGLACFFYIGEKVLSRKYAVVSTLVLALHPAWWLYSMRSLMPNVTFVTFLLAASALGVYALQCGKKRKEYAAWAGVGLFVAAALAVRLSEWVWILFGAVSIALIAQVRVKQVCIALCAGALGISALFAVHAQTYGSFFATGYTVGTAPETTPVVYRDENSFILKILFPFGLHLRDTLKNSAQYGVHIAPIFFVLSVMGFIWCIPAFTRFIKQASSKDRKKYISACIFATLGVLYLVFLYGSWTFFDNPDPSIVSLGNSHVRYWLPLFVLGAPLATHALFILDDTVGRKKRVVLCVLLVLLGIASARQVFFAHDGVVATRAALETFYEKREAILAATPKDAIVIVDRADKYVWPYRAVVLPLRSDATWKAVPEMFTQAPLYYFGITLPPEDLTYIRDVMLKDAHLEFVPLVSVNEETLYEVQLKK